MKVMYTIKYVLSVDEENLRKRKWILNNASLLILLY